MFIAAASTIASTWKHKESQQAHEKILNITNYQRNANQNYDELPPHTNHNDHIKKKYIYIYKNNKCWGGCGEN